MLGVILHASTKLQSYGYIVRYDEYDMIPRIPRIPRILPPRVKVRSFRIWDPIRSRFLASSPREILGTR